MRYSFGATAHRNALDLIQGISYDNGGADNSTKEVIAHQLPMTGQHSEQFVTRLFLRRTGNLGQYHDFGAHTHKGHIYEGNRGTGIIGKWFAPNFNTGGVTVTRNAAGGANGTGYGFSWGDAANSNNFGRFLCDSRTAGDTATFTYTGFAMGIVGANGRTSNGVAFIKVDSDWTKANGHMVQTVTAPILATWNSAGRTNFTDSDGSNVTISVGMKFFDFNFTNGTTDASLSSEEFILWQGSEGSHVLKLVSAGFDYAGSTSNKTIKFSCFWGSSLTYGLLKDMGINGTQYLPTSADLTAWGWYILADRQFCGAKGYSNRSLVPPVGADFQILGCAYEVKGKRAGSTAYFADEGHADPAGNTTGPMEQGNSGFRSFAIASAVNNAGQKVINLLAGQGTGGITGQSWWHENHGPGQLLTVASIAGNAITFNENLNIASGLSSYERLIHVQATVSGAVTNSKSVTLAGSSVLRPGDIIGMESASGSFTCAQVSAISGTALTLTDEATISDGACVFLVCPSNKGSVLRIDSVPVSLKPGSVTAGRSAELFVCQSTGSFDERTTLSAAVAPAASTVTVTSATNISLGDVIAIDDSGKGQYVGTVTGIAGATLTLDRQLAFYINSGARVYAAHTIKTRTFHAGVGMVGLTEIRQRATRGGDTYGNGYPWMVDRGRAIRFGIQGASQPYWANQGLDSYCVLMADGSVVRETNVTYPTPVQTTTAGGSSQDVTASGAIASVFYYGQQSGNSGTPVFIRTPLIRSESTRTEIGAAGVLVRKGADGSFKTYCVKSGSGAPDADALVTPAAVENHAIQTFIGEVPGMAAAINRL